MYVTCAEEMVCHLAYLLLTLDGFTAVLKGYAMAGGRTAPCMSSVTRTDLTVGPSFAGYITFCRPPKDYMYKVLLSPLQAFDLSIQRLTVYTSTTLN
jgi:hypothetical protein